MGSYDDTLKHSLEEDLRGMMGNPSFCDMLFLCGHTQEELPASRLLMAARSPVLESMLLKVGMAETKLTRIPLPAIDLSTMRICLEFLYTNTVKHSSWVHGFESPMMVIAAAKFFLVKRLEQIALSHLDSTICACYDFDACHLVDLTKAYSYGIKLHHAHPDIHLHNVVHRLMIRLINSRKFSNLECYNHLSEQALLHLLRNLDDYLKGENFPVIEYVRFLYVIWWCSSRLPLISDAPPQVKKLLEATLHDCLPWCIGSLCELLDAPKMSNLDANRMEFMQLLAEQLSGCLERVPMNISMIPSSVLRDVIEPLKIIPCPMLTTAYRLHAERKADDVRWDEFGHGDNYTIEREDATVISCDSDLIEGFARCKMFADVSHIVSFHWEVVILTPCEQFRIGLCWGEGLGRSGSYNNDPLGDHKYTLALNSDGTLLEPGEDKAWEYCDAFQGQKDITIGVHFYTRTCSFSINGKLVPEAWYMDWLSDEKLFLAVSMQRPGKVQIKTSTEDWDMWREKFK